MLVIAGIHSESLTKYLVALLIKNPHNFTGSFNDICDGHFWYRKEGLSCNGAPTPRYRKQILHEAHQPTIEDEKGHWI